MDKIIIYTDGSSHLGTRDGGYAFRIIEMKNGKEKLLKEAGRYEADTTNNRMEMMGAIGGVEEAAALGFKKLEVRSDSSYLINCFRQKWYTKWQKNGWKNAASKPVENKDLWERLLKLNSEYDITWIHVRGHCGVFDNERCDELAGKARLSKSNTDG